MGANNSKKGKMTDREYRDAYIKILETAPSRGGQEAPRKVIDDVETANIATIKAKVNKFHNTQKKTKKSKEEKGTRSMEDLKQIYKKLKRKHEGKSCYKEYKGPLKCSKISNAELDSHIKIFLQTRKELEAAVIRLETLDEKVSKKSNKSNKTKKTKKSKKTL